MTPTDATLGLTVRGARLDALDDETFAAIEDAWHAYAVLIFPGQNLSGEAQVAFSERFGPLERIVMKIHARHNPAIIHLSNVKEDGTFWPANSETGLLLKGNNYWHTDSSFKRIPAKAALPLYRPPCKPHRRRGPGREPPTAGAALRGLAAAA